MGFILLICCLISYRVPILMGIIILFQSLIAGWYFRYRLFDIWLLFMLILVFSGGVMVILMYICSVAINEIINPNTTLSLFVIPPLRLNLLIIKHRINKDFGVMYQKDIIWLYDTLYFVMVVWFICILLFGLFVVVNVVYSFSGRLQRLYE